MIRPMVVQDISRVSEIEKTVFTSAWSAGDFTYELTENPFGHYFVDEIDGAVEGYIGLWILFDQAQITTLGTTLNHRRQGIARRLMEYGLRHAFQSGAERISLEVRVGNIAAITLYESFGFQRKGIRKDYYQDNHEDAHLMVLERNQAWKN
ncbi:MAG: ribosomal-protein-alanine N-acetyltransferase [Firmicutes bacterium GWF2_51_9]|nr:ribosomal protein S18-alanine N-acetyltransferase [Erysipelotrichaceae bacterium]OGS53742.1 MAG: ribosomal-protein-alanine N-acetyltransferase [Firmicutes bacterium GWF2_51_9]OGS58286.1 MAG: ribosomal-protein-alanine N-acetyltransferase [Firmicutes bacterium GWE2_51_13]HAM63796.1 ribosomal-protein-alanine N-acetyltransferase [Erysipelotrichaceae bacterium]HAO60450.1 ribosomal-protein-alanine N-acetyltransferase [Erysipelotrichaceae bacterium]